MPKKKLINRSIRNSYTAKEKLDVVTYAKKTGIRTAARKYNIDHSMVLRWKKEEEKLKTAHSKARKIGTGCHPHYPDVEIVLKQWILELRQNAFCVTANNVKTQMKYLLENEFNEKYPNSSGNLKKPPYKLICKWILQAWEEISSQMIIKSFLKCGISNADNGSQDHFLYELDESDKEQKREEKVVHLYNESATEIEFNNNKDSEDE
ncbi:6743_t:CDS:2 [Acaulospora morrowiae]|uniref:6743_t:CDS:1 n=1 Tax=Acaulospora morrowiae TaxID=94023 RepID=A0A9N8W743_9GLOM|nr:6743_t:CDS:2 [Acaulospora morrowiae]